MCIRDRFSLIQKLSKNKQFFLTTHSTIFTGCNDNTSTYLITKLNGSTKTDKLTHSKELRDVTNILGHRNTDLFGDECIVFIEGESEDVAFPIIAGSLGYDLCAKGIKLINVKGKDKFKKLEEYLKYLKGSGVIGYIIADGSNDLRQKLDDWARNGLIESDNWTMWNLEFEDCFEINLIVKAVNKMMEDRGINLNLTSDKLNEMKKNDSSIVKVLKELFKTHNIDLDKPELSERLAILLNEEIQKKDHQKTLPELALEKIVKMVDKKYDLQKGDK